MEKIHERRTVLYQPLDTNEYKGVGQLELLNNTEFFDFFIGADPNDKEDFIGRVNDFLEYYDNKRELTENDFRKYQKDWAYFKRVITELAGLIGCDYEQENLEWIMLYLPEGRKTTLSDRAKELFVRAMEISDEMDIECNVDKAVVNITFYI